MKFTLGQWLNLPGYEIHHARQLFELEQTPDTLTAVVMDKRSDLRCRALDAAFLTVKVSSPAEDVISVKVVGLTGAAARKPDFVLQAQTPPEVIITQSQEAASLTSANLTARLATGANWRLDFLAGRRLLTDSGEKALAYVIAPDGKTYLVEQLGLGVGECVYGLGERFTPLVKNGQPIEMWNEDGGTCSEWAYKNIPFYLTNQGYGVFVNHPGRVSFEVASEKTTRVQFSVAGEELEYFVIYGPTPKEVLQKYTALTGRAALPPPWSFGLWLSTSFTTDYDEQTVTEFIQGMAERGIPLSVFHFDCLWMKDGHWVDFAWDEKQFPDPGGLLRRLKQRNLHICVWINSYIAQRSRLFKEAAEKGYLLKRSNGATWQSLGGWQPGMGVVDFTNPEACGWYSSHLRQLLKMGVDCFKTDFGERIPLDVTPYDGSDPERLHNFYPYLYNQTVFKVLEEARGRGEAVVFARSATAGSQRFPVHWGGDCWSTFESMAESLRGGLSFGLSGFGFWSHDMGGFAGKPPAAVYKRWIAFGLLSSHSRLHGSSSYRVPWLFDEEAVEILRHFTRLKCRLMPYLFQQAVETTCTGVPMLRAMLLEFPADPAVTYLDRQYMLGESLLVAPVFSEREVVYYVPAGRWTNFFTGEVIRGPGWREEEHDYLSLPLLVRPNTLLAVGACEDHPDYDYADGVTFHLYELEEDATARAILPNLQGQEDLTVVVRRRNEHLAVTAEGNRGNWQLLLVNIQQVAAIEGGRAEATPTGTRIIPAPGVERLTVKL